MYDASLSCAKVQQPVPTTDWLNPAAIQHRPLPADNYGPAESEWTCWRSKSIGLSITIATIASPILSPPSTLRANSVPHLLNYIATLSNAIAAVSSTYTRILEFDGDKGPRYVRCTL